LRGVGASIGGLPLGYEWDVLLIWWRGGFPGGGGWNGGEDEAV